MVLVWCAGATERLAAVAAAAADQPAAPGGCAGEGPAGAIGHHLSPSRLLRPAHHSALPARGASSTLLPHLNASCDCCCCPFMIRQSNCRYTANGCHAMPEPSGLQGLAERKSRIRTKHTNNAKTFIDHWFSKVLGSEPCTSQKV